MKKILVKIIDGFQSYLNQKLKMNQSWIRKLSEILSKIYQRILRKLSNNYKKKYETTKSTWLTIFRHSVCYLSFASPTATLFCRNCTVMIAISNDFLRCLRASCVSHFGIPLNDSALKTAWCFDIAWYMNGFASNSLRFTIKVEWKMYVSLNNGDIHDSLNI